MAAEPTETNGVAFHKDAFSQTSFTPLSWLFTTVSEYISGVSAFVVRTSRSAVTKVKSIQRFVRQS